MNIIFLDVDGVLNDDYSPRFDTNRIKIINRKSNPGRKKTTQITYNI